MDKPIEIAIPAGNTAADWNAAIKEGAEKAGVPLPVPGATVVTDAAAAAAAAEKKDEPVLYRATLKVGDEEMIFENADAAQVLAQYTAAVKAAQLAPPVQAAAAAKTEEVKPAFTDVEMFDIQTGLMKGDTKALDTYILKSDLFGRYLQSQGLSVEQIKAATTKTQSTDLTDKWKDATEAFTAKVKAGEIEYPGGEQNTQMMGFMIASLGLGNKPSVESFEQAFAEMKKRNLVFKVDPAAAAAATTEPPKKPAPGSTAVGSVGGQDVRGNQAGKPTGTVELDITTITTRQATESYNELVRRGYTPEQIKIKQ